MGKRGMGKWVGGAAIAAGLAVPAAYAADLQFSGDFDARGYIVDDGTGSGSLGGFDQRARLGLQTKLADGVQFHGRINFMNDSWRGDNGGDYGNVQSDASYTTGRDHRMVSLDYGYVQVPIEQWILRVGRQIANWNHDLTVSDDRRDRFLLLRPMGGTTVLTGFDVRRNIDETDNDDDGYLFFAGLIGTAADWRYGFLAGHYAGRDNRGANYVARGATLVSPWVQGEVGGVDLRAGMHYITSGDDDVVFVNNSYAGMLRGGMELSPRFRAEAQYFFNFSGSLVAPGFDTFSSLIHNSPQHGASATAVGGLALNGAGSDADDFDRHLVAARLIMHATDWLDLKGAVGSVQYDGLSGDLDADESITFVDFQAHYDITDSTSTWLTVGMAQAEDVLGDDAAAVSLNMRTTF